MSKSFFFISLLFISVASWGQDRCSSFYAQLYPKSETIDSRLYAVHLTDFLPQSGILSANSAKSLKFSPTLHFSLGAPVVSHSAGNWENKKYAILLPLKYIKSQMLNLFHQDTFIIGDLKLPEESVLLIPRDEEISGRFKGKIIYYDPNEPISDVVRRYLKDIDSIVLEPSGPFLSDKFFWKEKEVVELDFFKKYFLDKLTVTHMLHSESVIGELQMGVHNFFANWLYRKKPSNQSLYELKYNKLVFEEQMKYILSTVEQMQMPLHVNESIDKQIRILRKLLNIMEVDILLQEKYQRSVFSVVEPYQAEIINKSGSLKELSEFVFQRAFEFPEVRFGNQGKDDFLRMSVSDLHFLSFESYKEIARQELDPNQAKNEFAYRYLLVKKALSLYATNKDFFFISKDLFVELFRQADERQISLLLNLLREMIPNEKIRTFFSEKYIRDKLIQAIGESRARSIIE